MCVYTFGGDGGFVINLIFFLSSAPACFFGLVSSMYVYSIAYRLRVVFPVVFLQRIIILSIRMVCHVCSNLVFLLHDSKSLPSLTAASETMYYTNLGYLFLQKWIIQKTNILK